MYVYILYTVWIKCLKDWKGDSRMIFMEYLLIHIYYVSLTS